MPPARSEAGEEARRRAVRLLRAVHASARRPEEEGQGRQRRRRRVPVGPRRGALPLRPVRDADAGCALIAIVLTLYETLCNLYICVYGIYEIYSLLCIRSAYSEPPSLHAPRW